MTVAANALKWGTGSINVDASRIGTGTVKQATAGNRTVKWGITEGGCSYEKGTGAIFSTEGRWPANLILRHLDGCRKVGSKRVKPTSVNGSGPIRRSGIHSEVGGHQTIGRVQPSIKGYAESDGLETLDAWECKQGCPVAGLDEQSESSRFFKQVQHTEDDMKPVPQDLIDYLVTMISPPSPHPPAVFWDGLDGNLDTNTPDNTLTGLLLRGQPTDDESAELLRILRPGAHLLLIAPDEEPTGHTGACRIEDAGFEIRDSILWAKEASGMHYVPKASRSEREAGCRDLPAKTGAEAVNREEDTAGLNNPRAGAGRTAGEVHNFHPTVKPIDLMERLLLGIPTDEGAILDPFTGSGTTGVACIRTGHDFIGIERESDYLAIIDARLHHWKEQIMKGDKWDSLTIESEYVPPVVEQTESSCDDVFGW